jgi:hypothetical protein
MAGVTEETSALAKAERESPVARAMAAPALSQTDVQAPSAREMVEQKWRTSTALRELGVVVEAVPGGWRFSRSSATGREELFRADVSDAAGARSYQVAKDRRVKLLVVDAQGADCAEKKLELNGKTLTVEALLRLVLEK